MRKIEVGAAANGDAVRLAYQDIGNGPPVVLIHGWPFSHAMWTYQMEELPRHGLRVIAYDRRGFGHSSKPWDGYDYDTFADDLRQLLDALDVRDATLVGYSMGGGEAVRYMARHGGARVARLVLLSSVTPYLGQGGDNFDHMIDALRRDWPDFLAAFGRQLFNIGTLKHPVSQATLDWMQSLALQASLKATIDCVHAFAATDFRQDLRSIAVPTLVMHGNADQIVPLQASGARTAELLQHAQYHVYEGGSHGVFITHKERLNQDLVRFIRE
ncbi:alpha/beta hydrolase [Oxalobacteraceae bacterium OM1]|nr:alpha/beta hydrolase [Oxalobacteraceae bacterium OM1]